MTYGVYTKDLKYSFAQGLSKTEASRYKRMYTADAILCTERYVTCGFEIGVVWHREWLWRFHRGLRMLDLGPLTITWRKLHYLTADKPIAEEG